MKYKINVERLREKREQKGWNKLIAAQEMGIFQSVYSRYESGERTPTYPVIKSMAQYLGTSAEYLTDQTDNPKPYEFVVSPDDSRLSFIIETYNKLPNEQQDRIYKYVQKINDSINV